MNLAKLTICSLLVLVTLLTSCKKNSSLPDFMTTVTLPDTVLGPREIVANPNTGYVYVLSNSGHVTVFQREKILTTLRVGEQDIPKLDIDVERGIIYVLNGHNNTTTLINNTEVVTTLEMIGVSPTAIAIGPDGVTYVTTRYSVDSVPGEKPIIEGNVTVISNTQVIGAIPLGKMNPVHVAIDPIHNYLYVGAVKGLVSVITESEVVAQTCLSATVVAMDVNVQTGEVYILDAYSNLAKMEQGHLARTVNVGGGGGEVLKVHPHTGDVYIAGFGEKELIVIHNMQVVARLPLGWAPAKMAIDPLTGNIYVANFKEDTVIIIRDAEIVSTIPVGWYPYGIGVNPQNGWVYVSNTNDNSVTILGFTDKR